jgi:hypothetical protein
MTEQRPNGTGGDPTPDGYQPPSYIPPQGSDIPAPPLYTPPLYGQEYGRGQSGSGYDGGQYGRPYAQPGNPYGNHGSAYGQQYAGPYGQPHYGMPPYVMPAEPKTLSIASLCCGIAVFVGFGFIILPQIAAVILGHMALRREPSGRGLALAGLVMGYIGLALTALAIVGLALLFSVAATSSYSTV